MTEQLEFDFEGEYENSPQSMVEHFHWRFGCPIDNREPSIVATRLKLIREEYHELKDELDGAFLSLTQDDEIFNLGKISKEMADLLYVVYGTAVALGIDLEEAFRRVHQSNMSKLGVDGRPIFREDGKVLKGPNYYEPDMTGIYRENER